MRITLHNFGQIAIDHIEACLEAGDFDEPTCWAIKVLLRMVVEKENPMSQKPSIGIIVHYQRYGTPGGEHLSEPSPAVIIQILEQETGTCQLFIMNPNGLYFNTTPYSETPKPGHWNWPPRN